MMRSPHMAEDVFETRVLARQERRASAVTTAINSTVTRVKTSTKGAALAKWTSAKTSSMVALGKTAAGAMSAGVERMWTRIERSPGVPQPAAISCTVPAAGAHMEALLRCLLA